VSPATVTRRTQRERTEATTGQLVSTGRKLFAKQGYAGTSLDQICEASGVTKGALYHHFAGKHELFEAVFREEERRLSDVRVDAFSRRRDPWAGFIAGVQAYLEALLDPGVQHITILDAPSVLGWDRMREIQAGHSLALVKEGLRRSAEAGRIRRRDTDALAHIVFGSICEASMYIARAEDQDAALREVSRELRGLLSALET
jgi:AcrR family transcriptional regulator